VYGVVLVSKQPGHCQFGCNCPKTECKSTLVVDIVNQGVPDKHKPRTYRRRPFSPPRRGASGRIPPPSAPRYRRTEPAEQFPTARRDKSRRTTAKPKQQPVRRSVACVEYARRKGGQHARRDRWVQWKENGVPGSVSAISRGYRVPPPPRSVRRVMATTWRGQLNVSRCTDDGVDPKALAVMVFEYRNALMAQSRRTSTYKRPSLDKLSSAELGAGAKCPMEVFLLLTKVVKAEQNLSQEDMHLSLGAIGPAEATGG